MTRLERTPLFPLDVVLVPGMLLPLHIFEPRYKEMIRRCLAERIEFGLVYSQSEGIASVGCSTEIVRVAREYPDGQMDIVTTGTLAFAILEVHEGKPYLEATVEYRIEKDDSPSGNTREVVRLFAEAQRLLANEAGARLDLDSTIPLSYQVAGALPIEHAFKQKLLEMESEEERRSELVTFLKMWLSQLDHSSRVRRKAGGNGHGIR